MRIYLTLPIPIVPFKNLWLAFNNINPRIISCISINMHAHISKLYSVQNSRWWYSTHTALAAAKKLPLIGPFSDRFQSPFIFLTVFLGFFGLDSIRHMESRGKLLGEPRDDWMHLWRNISQAGVVLLPNILPFRLSLCVHTFWQSWSIPQLRAFWMIGLQYGEGKIA